MKYSDFLVRTEKSAREFEAVNATLLQKGGFIHQTMAGVYTFLPLGLRVLNKIEAIVRQEMDAVASELLMPALSPAELWERTGRREKIDVLFAVQGGNEASRAKNGAEYVLNSTHEELTVPILQQLAPSYKDLPKAVYQIQTKYRNEPRPKSGLLRGREFRMKDLYSFHVNEDDLKRFYQEVIEIYKKIYNRLGLGDDTHVALASGGDFTKDYSHEFQTICESGEDTIYYDEGQDIYYNEEVVPENVKVKEVSFSASEVGNVYQLGTVYSKPLGYTVQDESGVPSSVVMGSYGLGTSRVMGVMVEKFHDGRGIIWPDAVAPFAVHLASLDGGKAGIVQQAQEAYTELQKQGVEVLWDDRPVSAGEKLGDADLLGCPWRIVITAKTEGQVELKKRSDKEVVVVDLTEAIRLMTERLV